MATEPEIDLILDDLPHYYKSSTNFMSKKEMVFRLRDALFKEGYPQHLISIKVVRLLEDFNVTSGYIKSLLGPECKMVTRRGPRRNDIIFTDEVGEN